MIKVERCREILLNPEWIIIHCLVKITVSSSVSDSGVSSAAAAGICAVVLLFAAAAAVGVIYYHKHHQAGQYSEYYIQMI